MSFLARRATLVTEATPDYSSGVFDSDPSATTFTENAALSIASGDWINHSAAGLYIAEKAIDAPFLFATGERTIYSALIAGGVINLSSTASIEAIIGAELD